MKIQVTLYGGCECNTRIKQSNKINSCEDSCEMVTADDLFFLFKFGKEAEIRGAFTAAGTMTGVTINMVSEKACFL